MERPVAVTIFSVLYLVFGSMALLCTPISIAMVFAVDLLPTGGPTVMPAAMKLYTVVSGSLGLVIALAQVGAGIGLWQMRRWGLRTALGVAVANIAMVLLGLVVTLVFVVPEMANAAHGPQAAAQVGGAVGGVVGSVFGLILPGCALYFLTRPEVDEAFRAAEAGPYGVSV